MLNSGSTRLGAMEFTSLAAAVVILGLSLVFCCSASAQRSALVLTRGDTTIALEPYSPSILRVTLSVDAQHATDHPGYGFVAVPSDAGWKHTQEKEGDLYQSNRLTVHLSPANLPESGEPHPMPLDEINNALRDHYFGGGHSKPRHGPHFDEIRIATSDGKPLLTMQSWSMKPNLAKDSTGEPDSNTTYSVSATFDSPADEHYYGMGQHQQGYLDLRDHRVPCWHEYTSIGGETLCVPFMVSSRNYGIVWDNPSKTSVDFGFNAHNVWSSEVGKRVSFFVISGNSIDEVYSGYRQLTGVAHMLPKAAYGFIQSKAIYPSQEQLMAVAQGYRQRHLPADILVVDFLNMTQQGEMDLDPARWPDPAGMNRKLNGMGFTTLLSVWPHYAPGTQFYDMLQSKHWLIHKADGTADFGGFKPEIGPNIDTTNPDAARWWWEKIRDRYIKPDGFDYIWLDETEPDIDPAEDFFHVGSGAAFYNVYPLFHTASVYDGFRRDFGEDRRVFSLVRAAYTGAQANGTVFWSSDIQATWDMLKRSIPAGLDFTASGMPYWDTDIAGFFSPQLPADYKPLHPPLIDPRDALENVDRYVDYPELFVRWFEWGAFMPVMRAHGERQHNEVWSYGKQAETILSKYLRLRYQLMPYTYSLGYTTYQTGAPFMRALFMDFPNDKRATDIPDEYMYGPAILVAPVTDQGATERDVYLPAGTDWYNYWTNERLHGGQTIKVSAPIDTLPLFVRAGSIIPTGVPVDSTQQSQAIARVLIYPGANSDFTLFSDDGHTYAYEKGKDNITHLHWDDSRQELAHDGATPWNQPDASIIQVIHSRK